MMTTPPGWHDDGHGVMRWWDGGAWTEHVAVPGTDPGSPVAPAQPTKSKRWITWVVVAVVVVGALVAGAVLVTPLIVGALARGLYSGVAIDKDQLAAVAVVELYDEAWQSADCDAYLASTTEAFRTQTGLIDCSAFETEAESFHAAVADYEVEVNDVWRQDDHIKVATTETYTQLIGDDGDELDEPTEESIDWLYTVVSVSGDWVIDNIE